MNNTRTQHLSKQDAISASAYLGQQTTSYLNYFDQSTWGVDFPQLRHKYTNKSLLIAYMLDYVTIGIMLGLIGFFSLTHHPDPLFTLDDPSLAYPLVDEIVPNWLFFVLCLAVPSVVFFIVYLMIAVKNKAVRGDFNNRVLKYICPCAFVSQDTRRESKARKRRAVLDPHNVSTVGFHDLHHAFLGLAMSVMISLLICSFLWVVSPGLRPNHYAVCRIQKDKIKPGKVLYSTKEICAEGAFESSFIETPAFPSGHAANAFGCWIFTFLYLNGKFKIWDNNSHAWKVFSCFAVPVLIPTGIAASRYTDYHHSGFQIIFGSCVGVIAAFASYRIYFCSFFDNKLNHLATCFTWVSDKEYKRHLQQQSVPHYTEDSGISASNKEIGVPVTTCCSDTSTPIIISTV